MRVTGQSGDAGRAQCGACLLNLALMPQPLPVRLLEVADALGGGGCDRRRHRCREYEAWCGGPDCVADQGVSSEIYANHAEPLGKRSFCDYSPIHQAIAL